MSAYPSVERVPESTLAEITGPGRRHQVNFHALPHRADANAPRHRSPMGEYLYGKGPLPTPKTWKQTARPRLEIVK